MAIKSYLVFPLKGMEDKLFSTLSTIENSDVIPSNNKEVFVLVTDTAEDTEDEHLISQLQSQEYIHHISLISGFSTDKI